MSGVSRRSSEEFQYAQAPLCPNCGSSRVWKDGLRPLINGVKAQRWLCRDCSYRFTDMSMLKNFKNHQADLKLDAHQEGLTLLVEETKQQAEAGKREATAFDSQLFNYAWWMKKQGYADNTVNRRVRLLSTLLKHGANLLDPESVKDAIARQKWSLKTKELAVEAYNCFLKMNGGTWDPPIYKPVKKLPFIPLEAEIDALISGCNRKTATFLQLLKETGARFGEAWRLEWIDVDFQNRLVKITPEKGGEPRVIKVSEKLIAMLNSLPKDECRIFTGSPRHFVRGFRRQRKKIALKLQNDRVLHITFHTFRHWKATMEYHKTKDILHVMKLLGHRNINNTLIYTQLVNFESYEYHSATAKTVEEASKLVESGFEYVCTTPENIMLFRRRK
ncbi:MAG: site-specific integrase [Candidatus Bathyarchaeia archaeon]